MKCNQFFAEVADTSINAGVQRVISEHDLSNLITAAHAENAGAAHRVALVIGGNAYMTLLHNARIDPEREVRTVMYMGRSLTETFSELFQCATNFTHRVNGNVGHWNGYAVMSDVDLLRTLRDQGLPTLHPTAVHVVVLGANDALVSAKHLILG